MIWLGWGVLLIRTFLINHFELFGLLQVCTNLTGRALPEPEFHTPLYYRHVLHSIVNSCGALMPLKIKP